VLVSIFVAIGVDPGDSTGLRVLVNGQPAITYQGDHTRALELLNSTLTSLRDQEVSDVYVGCERFVTSHQPGKYSNQPTAGLVAAQVRYVAESFERPCTMQSPGDAKKLAPNHILKRLNLYVTGQAVGCRDANDVNDATRHALLLIARHRASLLDRMLGS